MGFQFEKIQEEKNTEINFRMLEDETSPAMRKSKLEAIEFPVSPRPPTPQQEEVKLQPAHVERFLENGKF